MSVFRATHALMGALSVLVSADSEEEASDATALFAALDRAGIKYEIEWREFDGAVEIDGVIPHAEYEEAARRAGYVQNEVGRWEDPAIGEDGVTDAKQLCDMMNIPPFIRDPVKIGASYRLDYPTAFKTLPDYTAHAGQEVKVLHQLRADEADQENERMYEIEAGDGWKGHADASELVEV
jgi:hypothetical protein